MSRAWIVYGDVTTSGGRVVTCSAETDIDGKGVARFNDKATCPQHKGVFPIVGGCDPTTIIDGQPVALHGAGLACGCKVLATQQIRVLAGGSGRKKAAFGNAALSVVSPLVGSSSTAFTVEPVPPTPDVSGDSEGVHSSPVPTGDFQARPMPSISAKGSADATDLALVEAELAKIPAKYRQQLVDNDVEVVVVRGSVTDYYTELQGVRPRGWPPGKTWDDVPGMSRDKTVVIATRGHGVETGPHVPLSGDGHGSYNLVMHETAHTLHNIAGYSPEFLNARSADLSALSAYESQAGEAGLSETFAESFANVFGGNSSYSETHPNLHRFWSGGS